MKFKNGLDVSGILVAILCVFHCVALPLISNMIPLFFFETIENFWVDIFFLIISFTIGLKILIPSYQKNHKNKLPIIFFCFGIFFLFIKNFILVHNIILFSSIGLCCIILSHILNIVLVKKIK